VLYDLRDAILRGIARRRGLSVPALGTEVAVRGLGPLPEATTA
jgi:hypothetical protein